MRLCLKIPRNVPVKSCMKRWEVKSWRQCNAYCVSVWICRETGLLHLQLQCLSCPSWLLASAGDVCAQCQATAVSLLRASQHVWTGGCVSLTVCTHTFHRRKHLLSWSRTHKLLHGQSGSLLMFFWGETVILTKVFFLFTTCPSSASLLVTAGPETDDNSGMARCASRLCQSRESFCSMSSRGNDEEQW